MVSITSPKTQNIAFPGCSEHSLLPQATVMGARSRSDLLVATAYPALVVDPRSPFDAFFSLFVHHHMGG